MAGALHPLKTSGNAVGLAREVGRLAAPFAAMHDRDATFVEEGYAAVRDTGFGTLAVPQELGGGGHGLPTICRAQVVLARYCANTSLAISMHQHAVLTMAWRWERGDEEVERVLRRVVDDGLLLSSSGTLNLKMINVTAELCEGGVLVNGRKRLCSGAPGADLMFTSAKIGGPDSWRPISVLVPLHAPGVEIVPDWDSMGMRGSGSNSVQMTDAFVPEANVLYLRQALHSTRRRNVGNRDAPGPRFDGPGDSPQQPAADAEQGPQQGMLLPGLHISLAVIASAYLGAASGVRDNALRLIAGTPRAETPATHRLAGLMTQEWRTAQWVLDGLIHETTDVSIGTQQQFVATMVGKRQIVLSSIHIVELAMEMLGAKSYMKDQPFEQALRDVRAGITHPLSPEATLDQVGRTALAWASNHPNAD
jgi:alkylation response protein AidB-like acyl-CoA dehydrogenase